MDVLACKEKSRKLARQERDAIPDAEKVTAAISIAEHFQQAVTLKPGSIVAGYWPVRGEADPRPLMYALAKQGHSLALPHSPERGNPLIFREWAENAEMISGRFGIREPLPTAKAVVPDIVLVPLVAYDNKGNRLGGGRRYYDLTLAALRDNHSIFAVGIAFEVQKLGNVFPEPHDQRLDMIVTEKRVYQFAKLSL